MSFLVFRGTHQLPAGRNPQGGATGLEGRRRRGGGRGRLLLFGHAMLRGERCKSQGEHQGRNHEDAGTNHFEIVRFPEENSERQSVFPQ